MVQHHELTLSSFTIRITICLWQSPAYPDSKQLERPDYQMLHFSFLLLNTRHSAFGSPDKEEGKQLGFMEAGSFVAMADDAGSLCIALYGSHHVFPRILSSALRPAVLCLPCRLF